MTTIVGLKFDGKVCLGCDSHIVFGWQSRELPAGVHKIFQTREMLIGVAGPWRTTQILQYGLPGIAIQSQMQRPLEYLVTVVLEKCRQLLKEHGHSTIENNKETNECAMLIAYRGELYKTDDVYAVRPVAENYEAIGSGSELALGALAALHKNGVASSDAMLDALAIAAKFDMGTRGPFFVKELKL